MYPLMSSLGVWIVLYRPPNDRPVPPCKEPYTNVYSPVQDNKGVEKTTQ
jgi:hypothetical protein